MTLTFPLALNYSEVAALPKAADHFSFDDSMLDEDTPTFADFIADYASAYSSSSKLHTYLSDVGYEASEEGVIIRDENALRLAHALFCSVLDEYDRPDVCHPTWELFNLGGDDDVDYCGSQPSCLTSVLVEQLP